MAGGSHSPDGDDDGQCIHCGRWYARAGLLPHERNCEWSDTDARMHDLEDDYARLRAPDVDEEADEDGADVDDLPGEQQPAHAGPEAPATPEQEAPGSDPTPASATARTDGGPSPVPDSWDDADQGNEDDVDDADEESGDGACPKCGESESFDVELLPDEALEEVPELLEYDQVCHPCSTDEKGQLTGTVEVFNVDE